MVFLSILGSGKTKEERLEEKKAREAEKVLGIIENAQRSNNLYQTAEYLKEFLKAVGKSKLGIYEPTAAREILLKKTFSIANTNNHLKQRLDSILEGNPDYVPMPTLLQDFDLTEKDVIDYCFEEKKKELNHNIEDLFQDVIKSVSKGFFTKEQFKRADKAFSELDQLQKDFKVEDGEYNDLRCKVLFDIGTFGSDAFLKDQENNTSPNFFFEYKDRAEMPKKFLSRLTLTEEKATEAREKYNNFDKEALCLGVKSLVGYVQNTPIEERASDEHMRFYTNLRSTLGEHIGQLSNEELKKKLREEIETADTPHRNDLKAYEEVLCSKQDELYSKALEMAENFDLTPGSQKEVDEALNSFVEFSRKYSTLLEEDEKTLNKAVEEINTAYRIVYHEKATQLAKAGGTPQV